MPIEHALKVLKNEFERIINIFTADAWKYYKFEQKGPYKRTLTKLVEMKNEMDFIIFENFGNHKENASFTRLIDLCLETAKDPEKTKEDIITFRKQLKRMQKQL